MIKQAIKFSICLAAALACGLGFGDESLLQRNVELIASPNVARDIKLTPEQLAAANKLFAAFQASRTEKVNKIESAPPDKVEAMNAEIGHMVADLDTRLLGLLTLPQKQRLLEIGVQQEGASALLDDLVAQKVGLNASQKNKIRTILGRVEKAQDDYQTAVAEAMSKVPDPKYKKQSDIDAYYKAKREEVAFQFSPQENRFEAEKTAGDKEIFELMTPAQQKRWFALHGKPLGGQITGG